MAEKSIYCSVLKATTLLGGSSAFRIVLEMVRRKMVAILLGPSGVGLLGLFQNIESVAGTVSEMGMRTSGVRQVALAYGSQDHSALSKSVSVLRRVVCVLGLVGAFIVATSSPLVSQLTFNSKCYMLPVAFLSISVMINELIIGQACVVQGCRRVKSLAVMTLVGAVNGTIFSLPILYLWREDGIVPSMIVVSLASLVTNWWFARKIQIDAVRLDWTSCKDEVRTLFVIGIPIMVSSLVGALSSYAVRVVIMRSFGLDGVGFWTAAFVLSGGLVSFILSAMAADYYPRLSAASNNLSELTNILNVQTEVALLLSLPALAATILFAPLGIWLFYDSRFYSSVPILQWSVFGILGKLIGWPMGYVLLAQGRSKMFLWTEIVTNAFYILFIIVCSRMFGLTGTGIAYFANYALYVPMMFVILRASRVRAWNYRISMFFVLCVAALVAGRLILLISNTWMRYGCSLCLVACACLYSLMMLNKFAGGLGFMRKRSP